MTAYPLVLSLAAALAQTGGGPGSFEVHGVVDARLVGVSGEPSWIDGGPGRSRYGPDLEEAIPGDGSDSATEVHLSQVSLVGRVNLTETLKAHVHANIDADGDERDLHPVGGIVEAFASYGHGFASGHRLRLRGGITIPPFSLEHPEVAWSTRYTITPSAIGTWLGEEVKSTGLEGTYTLAVGAGRELDLQGGIFWRNDTTGALLAWRGWALHDRQGMTGDELALPPSLALTSPSFFARQGTRTEPFVEVDGRPGFHAQGRLRLGGPLAQVQAGYYTSNGDTTQVDGASNANYAWNTHFLVVGAELRFRMITVLLQAMDGRAEMGFQAPVTVDAPFAAGYALVSADLGKTRVSGRYDAFRVEDEDLWQEGKDLNEEDGWAFTVALSHRLNHHLRLQGEYLTLRVDRPFAPTAGQPLRTRQHQGQVGVRLSF